MEHEYIPYRLSELLEELREEVEAAFPDSYWVVAEISSITNSPVGHCYLDLVETDRAGLIVAQCRANIWKSVNRVLAQEFKEKTGGYLQKGLKVLVKAVPTFSIRYGFSLNILQIEASFTLGELQAKRKATWERLEKEGLTELNKQLLVPALPCRIAIVSAEGAAGYGDFMKHLGDSGIVFYTHLFDAPMQGDAAPEGIFAAFAAVAERQHEFDAVVMIRGGGSDIDLACFDEYLVAKAIAECPLPVVSGIGHDRDNHICDDVACVSVKTPTAAAAYLIECFAAAREEVAELEGQLAEALQGMLERNTALLQALIQRVATSVQGRLFGGLISLERLSAKLRSAAFNRMEADSVALNQLKNRLLNAFVNALSGAGAQIDKYELRVKSADPSAILRRGYGIIDVDGEKATRIEQIKEGSRMRIRMQDGAAEFGVADLKIIKY